MGPGVQLSGSGKRLLMGECSWQSDQHGPGLGSRSEHGQWEAGLAGAEGRRGTRLERWAGPGQSGRSWEPRHLGTT